MDTKYLSQRLLSWFDQHGRKTLPWQHNPTPYRVWISEVMLQQTQVATVIPYYQRFMARFPDIKTLAEAELDEVLSHWSGLGYYARGRNLHAAAKIIQADHAGTFPYQLSQVVALPGIGRSTAGAILSLSTSARHTILDGNVKRVLARCFVIEGWPGKSSVEKAMWQLAEQLTPNKRVANYNQAIMDLGATCCTRSKPQCDSCPLATCCGALEQGQVETLPTAKPRKKIPVRTTQMLLIRNMQGEVLLEKRPPTGIWGGLWSLPEVAQGEATECWCEENLGLKVASLEEWPLRRHTFSHFHLDITPQLLQLKSNPTQINEAGRHVWYKMQQTHGLAAPVARLIEELSRREP
ncbi:MAG: A/G-specific adenine glycosylase [Candidatus Polarisedimenticolaceae bacterium]|nr:A/G-specific adenine glycosylase [Candidatus Polarisedimenticolaceae bacterium]